MEFDRETHFFDLFNRRCGTQGGASFTKAMVGDHGRMMIRFNTAKHSDQAAGTGFSVTVEAVESGMCKIKRIWPGQFQNMQNIVLKIINNQSTPNNNT